MIKIYDKDEKALLVTNLFENDQNNFANFFENEIYLDTIKTGLFRIEICIENPDCEDLESYKELAEYLISEIIKYLISK